MFGFLGKLFAPKPRSDLSAFAALRPDSQVFVFAEPQDDGFDASIPPDELLKLIERTARDVQERQDGFAPLIYERDGKTCLPFFTSQERSHTFGELYCRGRGRYFAFQILGIQMHVLATLAPSCEIFAMNDGSPDEEIVASDDVAKHLR